MPHRASVTDSPSISKINRSTPCVDGCCGPMLTTIRSSPRSACSDDQSVPVLPGDGVHVAFGSLAAGSEGILLCGGVR